MKYTCVYIEEKECVMGCEGVSRVCMRGYARRVCERVLKLFDCEVLIGYVRGSAKRVCVRRCVTSKRMY